MSLHRSVYIFAVSILPGISIFACRPAAAAQGLACQLTVRMDLRRPEKASQTVEARFQGAGGKVWLSYRQGGRERIFILNRPYAYLLIPATRSGRKWKVGNSQAGNSQAGPRGSTLDLVPEPRKIREFLSRYGARPTGTGLRQGQRVMVYRGTHMRWRGQTYNLTAWLRTSDYLPVSMILQNPDGRITASWSGYRKVANMPASRFQVPPGYTVNSDT